VQRGLERRLRLREVTRASARFRAAGAALALVVACAAPAALRAQTQTGEETGTGVQSVPAVIDFKDHDVYRGEVVLDYGNHAGIPTESGRVKLEDGAHPRRGYAALPNGLGTFVATNGTVLFDTDFERGLAQSWGRLVIPPATGNPGLRFEGLFHDSGPAFGKIVFGDGATYVGPLHDGCFSAPLDSALPARPPPGTRFAAEIAELPDSSGFRGTYVNPRGVAVTGVWHAGVACAGTYATDAHVSYPDGSAYAGDLDASGQPAGFGAFSSADPTGRSVTLVCATRADGAYTPGTVTVTNGHLAIPAADAHEICDTAYGLNVTKMTVTVAAPAQQLQGHGDVTFADGDRADAPVVDGALNGRGTYFDEAFPATIAGTFRNGGLDGPALLTDGCGNVYRMRVERNGVLVNVARSGVPEYLFHACDAFVAGPGGSVGRNGLPEGFGTKRQSDGETVTGFWRHGRIVGNMTVHVLRPYEATISVKDVREIADRYHGAAVVRFANGDVARGMLDGATLEGAGDYVFAATHCVARGTFKNGALRGPATLLCPNEPPYSGEIGRDGTVQ